jgi:hypothetical protein
MVVIITTKLFGFYLIELLFHALKNRIFPCCLIAGQKGELSNRQFVHNQSGIHIKRHVFLYFK